MIFSGTFVLIIAICVPVSVCLKIQGESGGPGKSWGEGSTSSISIGGIIHEANNAYVAVGIFGAFATAGSLTQKSGSYIRILPFSYIYQTTGSWRLEQNAYAYVQQFCYIHAADSVVMRPSSRIYLHRSSSFHHRAYVDMGPSSSIELYDNAHLELSCGEAACVIGGKSSITLGQGSSYYVYGLFSMGESCHVDTDTGAHIVQHGSLQLSHNSRFTFGLTSYMYSYEDSHINLDGTSNMTIGTGSIVRVYRGAELSIGGASGIETSERSRLNLEESSVLRLASQNKVELGVSSKFNISDGSKVLMEKPGASITIGDRAVLNVQNGSVCLVLRNVVIPSGEVVSASAGEQATNVPPGMTCYTAQEYYGG